MDKKQQQMKEKLRLLREAYAQFRKELHGLKKRHDALVQDIIKDIDAKKVDNLIRKMQQYGKK